MNPICRFKELFPFCTATTSWKSSSLRRVWLLALFGLLLPATVYAQGSVPALPAAPGTEALGRGGAFTAKADSPLALEYNVAGLAQLRGTQVLLDGQLWLPSGGQCLEFQSHNQRPCYSGLAAVTTDFGVLRRWSFALGFRLPEPVTAYGLPSFPGSVDTSPSPPWPPALIMAPSLAVGVQAHRRLALGLLVEDAMAFSLSPCPWSPDPSMVASCSGPQVINRSLMNPVVQLGLLGNLGTRPSTVMLAASVRSAPDLGLAPLLDAPQRTSLPWTIRAGARYLHRDRSTGRTIFDVELDGVARPTRL